MCDSLQIIQLLEILSKLLYPLCRRLVRIFFFQWLSDAKLFKSKRYRYTIKLNGLGSFTCPQCFIQLPNAEALQRHFRDQHELNESRNDGDLLTMQLEMKDLRAAVQVALFYLYKTSRWDKAVANVLSQHHEVNLYRIAQEKFNLFVQKYIFARKSKKTYLYGCISISWCTFVIGY